MRTPGRGGPAHPTSRPRPRDMGLRRLQPVRDGLPERRLLPAPHPERGWRSPAPGSTSCSRSSATGAGTAWSSAPRRGDPAAVKPALFLDPERFALDDRPGFFLARRGRDLIVSASPGLDGEAGCAPSSMPPQVSRSSRSTSHRSAGDRRRCPPSPRPADRPVVRSPRRPVRDRDRGRASSWPRSCPRSCRPARVAAVAAAPSRPRRRRNERDRGRHAVLLGGVRRGATE